MKKKSHLRKPFYSVSWIIIYSFKGQMWHQSEISNFWSVLRWQVQHERNLTSCLQEFKEKQISNCTCLKWKACMQNLWVMKSCYNRFKYHLNFVTQSNISSFWQHVVKENTQQRNLLHQINFASMIFFLIWKRLISVIHWKVLWFTLWTVSTLM